MLTRNFPARKLARQLITAGYTPTDAEHDAVMANARAERSKKDRSLRGRRNKDA